MRTRSATNLKESSKIDKELKDSKADSEKKVLPIDKPIKEVKSSENDLYFFEDSDLRSIDSLLKIKPKVTQVNPSKNQKINKTSTRSKEQLNYSSNEDVDDGSDNDFDSILSKRSRSSLDINIHSRTNSKNMYHKPIDYWKLPKKIINLNETDLEKLKEIRNYFNNVIDKHELNIV